MYHPPSDLNLFLNWFTGREDEPLHTLPHLQHVCAHLLVLYVHSLHIPEEHVLEMRCITVHEFEDWFHDCMPIMLHPYLYSTTNKYTCHLYSLLIHL